MSGEWVHPGQTLIWAVWVLAAATEGEAPSGRGGLSEDRVGGFPCLGGFSTGGNEIIAQRSLRALGGLHRTLRAPGRCPGAVDSPGARVSCQGTWAEHRKPQSCP